MKIYTVLRRGSDHNNFCQDFFGIGETPNFLYLCVFDGCSGGKDSHFASTLFSKAFNDVMKNFYNVLNDPNKPIEQNIKFLTYTMSRKVNETKQILHLDMVELLSTVVMCVINKNTKECLIAAFGDGYFHVDGTEVVIKNTRFLDKENGKNMPDYLAYDLAQMESYQDFDAWFASKSEVYKFENVSDVSISSDGICTFKKFKPDDEVINPIDYLVKDESLMDTKNMLERKYNLLNTKYHMINTDDVTVIRVKF